MSVVNVVHVVDPSVQNVTKNVQPFLSIAVARTRKLEDAVFWVTGVHFDNKHAAGSSDRLNDCLVLDRDSTLYLTSFTLGVSQRMVIQNAVTLVPDVSFQS